MAMKVFYSHLYPPASIPPSCLPHSLLHLLCTSLSISPSYLHPSSSPPSSYPPFLPSLSSRGIVFNSPVPALADCQHHWVLLSVPSQPSVHWPRFLHWNTATASSPRWRSPHPSHVPLPVPLLLGRRERVSPLQPDERDCRHCPKGYPEGAGSPRGGAILTRCSSRTSATAY